MTSMSAIAEVSNSSAFSSLGVLSADTVRVKKTDYPQDAHGEEFSLDLQDPENLKPDTAISDEKPG